MRSSRRGRRGRYAKHIEDDGYQQFDQEYTKKNPTRGRRGRPKTGRGRRVPKEDTDTHQKQPEPEMTPDGDWDLEGMFGLKDNRPQTTQVKEETKVEVPEEIEDFSHTIVNKVDQPINTEIAPKTESSQPNPDLTVDSSDPSKLDKTDQKEGEGDQPKEEEKQETSEERKLREDQEKREADIKALESQIAEQEALMFDWDDLESAMIKQKYIDGLKSDLEHLKNPNKKRKTRKTKKGGPKGKSNMVVNIFRPQMSKDTIVKKQLMTEKPLKLCNDPEHPVSNIKLDKLQKGMFNRSNNCFMNVILQSLFSIPLFYNFIMHFLDQSEQNELIKAQFDSNNDDSLLVANFLELFKYFDPRTGAGLGNMMYGVDNIDVEAIFKTLLMNFNPDKQQQDCHEFLGMMLDCLNNELHDILEKAGISTSSKTLEDTNNSNQDNDEWEEVGKKKLKMNNRAQDLIKNSPIFEIFGGCMREDINVEGKKNNTANLQPYLYLSLGITIECSIQDSLKHYFEPEELEGFKLGQKEAKASKKHSLVTVPNILILHIKRFIYLDRPVKTMEKVYFPDILELNDEYFAPQIQAERKKIREAAKAREKEAKAKERAAKEAAKQAEEAKLVNAVSSEVPEQTASEGVPADTKPKKKKKKAKAKPKNEEVKVQIHEQSEAEKDALKSFQDIEKYELIGVVVHKGKSIHKGHYITFMQDNYGNWVCYNDTECKPVTANIVLDQQAYMLMYRKFT